MKNKLNVIKKIKLMFYKNMFNKIKDKEESLSSSEYFCLECIYLMDKPTITEFAEFMDISAPNATYKVKTLIKKGLLEKQKSKKDGREYILVPTQKFFDLYNNKDDEVSINDLDLNQEEGERIQKFIKLLEERK